MPMANSQRPKRVLASVTCAISPTARAISSENGSSNRRPCPRNTNGRGSEPIELPSSVSRVTTQMAAPEKNIIVVSVTMNGGIEKRVTQAPFKAPTALPTAANARMPIGTRTIGETPTSGPPAWVMTAAPSTLEKANTDGADRSIPATTRTNICPIATIRSGMVPATMSRQVSGARISGTSVAMPRT